MMYSVIVPCFNAQAFLRTCLDSIVAQTFDDFEVVVINDGSTDDSAEILSEYETKYENISVYTYSNAGVAVSRRRGIELAKGEYVVFVDADDTINPDLLRELSSTVDQFDYPELIRYQSRLINDKPTKDHDRYNFQAGACSSTSGIEALRLWTVPGKKYAVYWLFAFKKTIFEEVPFDTVLRCYEDVAFIPIIIAASHKVVTIDYVGYNYFCNVSTSLTNKPDSKSIELRALYFYQACRYAMLRFATLNTVTRADIRFFEADYSRRLMEMYDSLPDDLKKKFTYWFAG